MQENNRPSGKAPVIVRAWGDEPVKLFLHRIENNRCYVGSIESRRPIGLPVDQVFVFNEDVFSDLIHRFAQACTGKKGEIWANMAVDDFSCNKYQKTVGYSHDQENISSSECVAGGNPE